MITLDLDHAILNRAPGAAQFLQSGRQLRQPRRIKGQPADDRHALAGAAGDLPSDAYTRGAVTPAARIKSTGCRRDGPQHNAAKGVFGLHA